MSRYVGDIVRIKVSFFDEEGEPADPETVKLTILPRQTGEPTEYEDLVEEDTGVYYLDYTIENPGVHEFRFEGTGTALTKVFQGNFYVIPQNV